MTKSDSETIAKFNEQVNMTLEELQAWFSTDQCHKAGTGVGLESGKKIMEILKKNPNKDPHGYDADLEHMHKVVGYISRHMAQEDHLKETKSREQLENSKSTISLRNWGHDPMKTLGDSKGEEAKSAGKASVGSPDQKKNGVHDKQDQDSGAKPEKPASGASEQKTNTPRSETRRQGKGMVNKRKRVSDGQESERDSKAKKGDPMNGEDERARSNGRKASMKRKASVAIKRKKPSKNEREHDSVDNPDGTYEDDRLGSASESTASTDANSIASSAKKMTRPAGREANEKIAVAVKVLSSDSE